MTHHIDPAQAALLVMDFQPQILAGLGDDGRRTVVDAANVAIKTARDADVPVIFVAVQYRRGYPDANPDNKRVSLLASKGMLQEGDEGVDLAPELDRRPDDPLVRKRRVSALAHTDLPPLLRSLGVRELVLAGVSTSGVVLSTVRGAADEDYRITVLRDGCADPNQAVHDCLTDDVLPLQAEVVAATDLAGSLQGAG